MDTKDVIEAFRSAVKGLQAEGRTEVPIAGVLRYLENLERDASTSVEYAKLQHASSLAGYAAERDAEQAMFKSVVEAAHGALKSSMLVNGGAAVALLGAASAVVGRKEAAASAGTAFMSAIGAGATMFGLGVLAAAIASGGMYLAQFAYHQQRRRAGVAFHVAAVLLVLGSYGLFAAGLLRAVAAF